MDKALGTVAALAAAVIIASAAPARPPAVRPEAFTRLIDCRVIADAGRRLACYDAAAGALEDAERKKELVVVDRTEIRATRKSLFGFALPRIGLFGGDGEDDKDEVREIAGTVQSARMTGGGDWSLRFADDAGTWETKGSVAVAPARGDKVRIRKASLGSYLGQVGLNRGVRFRRVE